MYNKDIIRYAFQHAFRQKDITDNLVAPPLSDTPVKEISSPNDSFLQLVYGLDPVTRLPSNDISVLMSDKVNPELKLWIQQNLMVDVSSAAMPTLPDGISDADAFSLARDSRESVKEYCDRLNTFFREQKEQIDYYNDQFAKLQKRDVHDSEKDESSVSS